MVLLSTLFGCSAATSASSSSPVVFNLSSQCSHDLSLEQPTDPDWRFLSLLNLFICPRVPLPASQEVPLHHITMLSNLLRVSEPINSDSIVDDFYSELSGTTSIGIFS
ncbi:uncharacterized protein LOC130791370 [Actinidia eriantha]|uniref:uncharacterized protein LOC130791370 n=1 Tax=Actinidia eriantha TaxID=165200 RepID=UPI0025887292|nr:uncharacterized protein LOC130791370 [Actinidia eriantha]